MTHKPSLVPHHNSVTLLIWVELKTEIDAQASGSALFLWYDVFGQNIIVQKHDSDVIVR